MGRRWSGREDLNLRPPEPHSGALPGCATPRRRLDASSCSGGSQKQGHRRSTVRRPYECNTGLIGFFRVHAVTIHPIRTVPVRNLEHGRQQRNQRWSRQDRAVVDNLRPRSGQPPKRTYVPALQQANHHQGTPARDADARAQNGALPSCLLPSVLALRQPDTGRCE